MFDSFRLKLKFVDHAGQSSFSSNKLASWHFCITFNQNKLKVVISGINYNKILHFLKLCLELKRR